jgi:hypothetical protein
LEPEHLTRRPPDCDLGVGTLSRSEGEELQDAQHTGRGAFLLADLALFAIGRRLKIIARLAVVAGFAFSFVCPVELVDSLR